MVGRRPRQGWQGKVDGTLSGTLKETMGLAILSRKSCDIIREEAGCTLQDLSSRPLNLARRFGIRLMSPGLARGSVRAVAGKILTPELTEAMRADASTFRLAAKSTGIRRLLRHFR